jgi:glucose/arabinose dehydrogenase
MRRAPSGFTRNSGDIDSNRSHGSMGAPDIANDAGEEIMHGITRYSVTIVASFCAVVLAADRAFGQMPKNDAAYGSAQPPPGLRRPLRVMREAPNGDLFIADTTIGAVRVLRPPSGSATAVRYEVFVGGLKQPFGIAFYPLGSNPRWVYIAYSDGVVRFRYRNGDLKAAGKPEQIVAGRPTTYYYSARDVAFSADGRPLYFTVGSLVDPHGVHASMVVTAQRDCEGMTVQPATGELGCIANGHGEPGANAPRSLSLQKVTYRGRARTTGAGGVVHAAATPPFAGALDFPQEDPHG